MNFLHDSWDSVQSKSEMAILNGYKLDIYGFGLGKGDTCSWKGQLEISRSWKFFSWKFLSWKFQSKLEIFPVKLEIPIELGNFS